MRKQRIFAIIFIFILTMLLTRSIYCKTKELYGNVGYDRFSIRLKGDSLFKNAFDKYDGEELERVLASELMTYYAFNKGEAVSEQSRTGALICGIKGEYSEFYNIGLKRGSFLNEKDYEEENPVAVIDEELAISLFGSEDVVGLDVYIYDKKFKIIGITGNDASIAGRLIEKDLPYAYIPLSIMEEAKQGYSIANIEFKADEDNFDKALIEDKIASIGRNPADFYIEDWNEIGRLSDQRFHILLFITGIYLICGLLMVVFSVFKNSINLLKIYLKDNYFPNVIKDISVKFLIAFGKIAGILIAIIFIWKEISFDLYILPGCFPEDPTNMSQIAKALRKGVMKLIKTDNSYMLYPKLLISFLHKQGSLIFMLSLFCELYILFFILKNANIYFNSFMQAIKGLGFYCAASLVLSYLVIYFMGFPAERPIKTIVLLWTGFFTMAMVSANKYFKPENVGVKDE